MRNISQFSFFPIQFEFQQLNISYRAQDRRTVVKNYAECDVAKNSFSHNIRHFSPCHATLSHSPASHNHSSHSFPRYFLSHPYSWPSWARPPVSLLWSSGHDLHAFDHLARDTAASTSGPTATLYIHECDTKKDHNVIYPRYHNHCPVHCSACTPLDVLSLSQDLVSHPIAFVVLIATVLLFC